MTHSLIALRDQTCAIPGCHNPRHVSRSGKVYSRCDEHYRQDYKRRSVYRGQHVPAFPRQREATPPPESVRILVIDWATEQLYHVTGTVECYEPLPRTDGELKRLLAKAAQQGIYVSKPQQYKESDLYNDD